MNLQILQTQLKKLKLNTAAIEVNEILSKEKKSVTLGWITELLSREIEAREEMASQKRIQQARLPEVKGVESFDFDFNPALDQHKIQQLITLEFVKKREVALFLGQPGTGKTHIALSIATKALSAGFRVYCSSAKHLCQQIQLQILKNRLDLFFKNMLAAQLWIIDDWGIGSMNQAVCEELFDLFNRRKYSSAMILTSNRDVGEWNQLFPDPVIANATIDRFFESAEVLIFEGKSYRLKGRIQTDLLELTLPKG